MDQNIKNRLVGVVVIFALAVIFLPMILDGSGVRKDKLEVIIPPQPLVTANPEFDRKIIELEVKSSKLPDLEPRFVDEESTVSAADPDDDPAAISEQPEAAEPAAVSSTEVASTEAETVAETRAVAGAGIAAGGDSWVLQVGSFQDRSKAIAQRDKLRKSNVAAVFIEQFEFDNRSSYRVRLGPFATRDEGRVAQNKIRAKHDIDGIIMKYER